MAWSCEKPVTLKVAILEETVWGDNWASLKSQKKQFFAAGQRLLSQRGRVLRRC